MSPVSLENARVTPAQAVQAQHLLAAAAHRRWFEWQAIVLPWLPDQKEKLRGMLEAVLLPEPLLSQIRPQSEVMVALVLQAVGAFAYPPDLDKITNHNIHSFRHWVDYTLNCTPDDVVRWRLQCRTTFLGLSPESQISDYDQALQWLKVVAEAGGLVLPDSLPLAKPRSRMQLGLQRTVHAMGLHGDYLVSEAPGSLTCQGCHARVAVVVG